MLENFTPLGLLTRSRPYPLVSYSPKVPSMLALVLAKSKLTGKYLWVFLAVVKILDVHLDR